MVGFGVLSVIVRGGAHAGGAAVDLDPASTGERRLALSSRISQEAADEQLVLRLGLRFDSGSGSSPERVVQPPQASTHTS